MFTVGEIAVVACALLRPSNGRKAVTTYPSWIHVFLVLVCVCLVIGGL